MRTLIWNITSTSQTLPPVYGDTVVPAGQGYVADAGVEAVVPALGGLVAIDGVFLVYPISDDEASGAVSPATFPQFFFDPALAGQLGNGNGVSSWNDLTDKPVFSSVATSGDFNDLTNKPTSVALSDVAPPAIGTATSGTAADASRSNHTHAHGDQAGGTLHSAATQASAGFLSSTDKTKLDGVAAHAAAVGTADPAPVAAAAAVGVSANAAREDHVHAHGPQSGGTLHAAATTAAAGFMAAADKSKLDGVAANAAAVGAVAPPAVAAAGAVGTSVAAARADHTHAHGAQTDGALHAAATTTTAGFMSAADKTKLDAISRAYDFYGYFEGSTPSIGQVLLRAYIPRSIKLSNLHQGPVGGVPVKAQIDGVDVTLNGADVTVAAGSLLTVLTTLDTGTEVYFTVVGREA